MAIAGNVARLSIFNNAKHIALYWPTSEEVSIFPLLDLAIEANKTCYLPVINTVDWRPAPMLFRSYHPGSTTMVKNRFRIDEPRGKPGEGSDGADMDLVIAPLVGFNDRCDRIGMGGGYYDRTFAKRMGLKLVGVAFDCQAAEFEPQPHDIPMDMVITESRRLTR